MSPAARAVVAAALASVAGCGAYRPPRFADAGTVTEISDRRAIAVPEAHDPSEISRLTESLVRRPVQSALDPRRSPPPGDVNALDEVVSSTWMRAAGDARSPTGTPDGPPLPPLTLKQVTGPDRMRIVDARGLGYELLLDYPRHPTLRTGAAAIAGHLIAAVGYLTPEVHVIDIPEELGEVALPRRACVAFESNVRRAAAIRGPYGLELGPPHPSEVRPDDPNDRVPHAQRRSLRALRVVAAWLYLVDVGPDITRDVYVGAPGAGHVLHLIVGLEDALGVEQALIEARLLRDPIGRPVRNLLTLGLGDPFSTRKKSPWTGLGSLSTDVDPEDANNPWPYDPVLRMTDADGYWMAKRIQRLPRATLEAAVAAGKLDDARASQHFVYALDVRRRKVFAHYSARVTPLEIHALDRNHLTLRDLSITWGFAGASDYEVEFFDGDGRPVGVPKRLDAHGDLVTVELPEADYVVARLRARGGAPHRRAMEVHVGGAARRVLGVRH